MFIYKVRSPNFELWQRSISLTKSQRIIIDLEDHRGSVFHSKLVLLHLFFIHKFIYSLLYLRWSKPKFCLRKCQLILRQNQWRHHLLWLHKGFLGISGFHNLFIDWVTLLIKYLLVVLWNIKNWFWQNKMGLAVTFNVPPNHILLALRNNKTQQGNGLIRKKVESILKYKISFPCALIAFGAN